MDYPVMRCPHCSYVGRPTLTPGTSTHTLSATCTVCHKRIKVVPKLGTVLPDKSR
jgi:hypothetical protein